MLILSRKRNEAVMVNDNVEIVVLEIRGDKVRLGFNAPDDVTIHRKEIYLRVQREQEKAGKQGSS